MKERQWFPDLDEVLVRAQGDLVATEALLTAETERLASQTARLAAATARAETLDAQLLAELEVQRGLKREFARAELLLERESARLVMVDIELATKTVRIATL